MTLDERKLFWETLCSLSGTDIAADAEILKSAIQYPPYLFRYRSVTMKTLDALRTNTLYFSSADFYDDPFDTFLHIDLEALQQEYLSNFETEEGTQAVADGIKAWFKGHITNELLEQINVENLNDAIRKRELLKNFLLESLALRENAKKDIFSVKQLPL